MWSNIYDTPTLRMVSTPAPRGSAPQHRLQTGSKNNLLIIKDDRSHIQVHEIPNKISYIKHKATKALHLYSHSAY